MWQVRAGAGVEVGIPSEAYSCGGRGVFLQPHWPSMLDMGFVSLSILSFIHVPPRG